jgi:hypothetical protein
MQKTTIVHGAARGYFQILDNLCAKVKKDAESLGHLPEGENRCGKYLKNSLLRGGEAEKQRHAPPEGIVPSRFVGGADYRYRCSRMLPALS